MSGQHSPDRSGIESSVSRRTFVKAAGGTGIAMGLAGCSGGGDGNGNGNGGGTTVKIAMGSTSIEDVKDGLPPLLHENGVDDDIEIDWSEQPDDTGEQRDQYIQLLQAQDSSVDLFMVDNGWANILVNRGLLANISEVAEDIASTIEDEYFGPFTDTIRGEEGDIYGVPMFPDFALMLYNKEYAREAGYEDSDFETWETEPMTWKEWAELVEEVQEASDAETGFTTQFDIYEGTSCCSWNEVMTSFGGAYFGGRDNLFGPVGDRPVTVDEPEFIEALRMMRTFVADEESDATLDDYPLGIADEDIVQYQENPSLSPFLEGDTAFHRNWPYAIIEALKEDYDDVFPDGVDSVGTMPIPYNVEEGEGNQQGTGGTASSQGGWHIAMNPYTENEDAVLQVLEAMITDEFNLGMMDVIGWLPPKPDLFESDEATDPDQVGDVANYMNTLQTVGANAIPRPTTQVWTSQAESIAEQVNGAVAGEKSPEDAASDLQTSLEEIEESG